MALPDLNSAVIFDRAALRLRRNRAALRQDNFFHERVMKEIGERLALIKRAFPIALQIGGRSALPGPATKAAGIETLITFDIAERNLSGITGAVHGDEEYLPFADNSLDLVLGLITFQGINDLPGTLIQIRRALKPDGLFIAAMAGGETLWQLRDSLARAELELSGGASPRVYPFADKQQIGALMQRAGFALPVVDSDMITVTYDNIFRLINDLRGMGDTASMQSRQRTIPPRALFARAGQIYRDLYADEEGRIEASFEIIFLSGWAPHDTQQKALRPGSADHSLALALSTQEKPC